MEFEVAPDDGVPLGPQRIAARALCEGEESWLRAELLDPDGKEVQAGEDKDPARLARRLLDQSSPALKAMFAG